MFEQKNSLGLAHYIFPCLKIHPHAINCMHSRHGGIYPDFGDLWMLESKYMAYIRDATLSRFILSYLDVAEISVFVSLDISSHLWKPPDISRHLKVHLRVQRGHSYFWPSLLLTCIMHYNAISCKINVQLNLVKRSA